MEEHFFIKLPPRLHKKVTKDIQNNKHSNMGIYTKKDEIYFKYLDNEYKTIFYDLPCIVEAQKTMDRKQFYKVCDISNCLYVIDNEGEDEIKCDVEKNVREHDERNLRGYNYNGKFIDEEYGEDDIIKDSDGRMNQMERSKNIDDKMRNVDKDLDGKIVKNLHVNKNAGDVNNNYNDEYNNEIEEEDDKEMSYFINNKQVNYNERKNVIKSGDEINKRGVLEDLEEKIDLHQISGKENIGKAKEILQLSGLSSALRYAKIRRFRKKSDKMLFTQMRENKLRELLEKERQASNIEIIYGEDMIQETEDEEDEISDVSSLAAEIEHNLLEDEKEIVMIEDKRERIKELREKIRMKEQQLSTVNNLIVRKRFEESLAELKKECEELANNDK